MDYGEIVSSSFKLAWQRKSLWLMGLFAGGASFPTNLIDWKKDNKGSLSGLFSGVPVLRDHPELIYWFLGIIVVLGLLLFVLHCFCTVGLIDAVNRLSRGGIYRLKDSFGEGVRFFWRFVGLTILEIFVMIVGAVVTIGPVVVAFFIHWAAGALALMVMLPLGFFLMVMTLNTFFLASRAMVVRDVGIGDALEEGWRLFHANKGSNIVIFLLYFLLTIACAVGAVIIFVIIGAPFVLLALTGTKGLIIALAVGIPVFLLLSLPISGFLGAAFEAMYTLFYFRLVEPAGVQGAAPVAEGI